MPKAARKIKRNNKTPNKSSKTKTYLTLGGLVLAGFAGGVLAGSEYKTNKLESEHKQNIETVTDSLTTEHNREMSALSDSLNVQFQNELRNLTATSSTESNQEPQRLNEFKELERKSEILGLNGLEGIYNTLNETSSIGNVPSPESLSETDLSSKEYFLKASETYKETNGDINLSSLNINSDGNYVMNIEDLFLDTEKEINYQLSEGLSLEGENLVISPEAFNYSSSTSVFPFIRDDTGKIIESEEIRINDFENSEYERLESQNRSNSDVRSSNDSRQNSYESGSLEQRSETESRADLYTKITSKVISQDSPINEDPDFYGSKLKERLALLPKDYSYTESSDLTNEEYENVQTSNTDNSVIPQEYSTNAFALTRLANMDSNAATSRNNPWDVLIPSVMNFKLNQAANIYAGDIELECVENGLYKSGSSDTISNKEEFAKIFNSVTDEGRYDLNEVNQTLNNLNKSLQDLCDLTESAILPQEKVVEVYNSTLNL